MRGSRGVSGFFVSGFVAAGLLMGMLGGCHCNCADKTPASSDVASNAKANASARADGSNQPEFTMQSGGKDVLVVTSLAAGTTCVAKDGVLHLKNGDMEVHLWLVPGATSVDEGVARVPRVIDSEFKNFEVMSEDKLGVPDGPPRDRERRLEGKGFEADDGDPGTAKVIVFKQGDGVFVACTHGERLSPASSNWLRQVVNCVRGPVVKMGK